MSVKQLGNFGFAAIAAASAALFLSQYFKAPSVASDEGAGYQSPNGDIAELRNNYESQLTELRRHLEEAQAHNLNSTPKLPVLPNFTVPPNFQEDNANLTSGAARDALLKAQKSQTERLIAAGFTQARIDWIKKRADELAEEYARTADQLRIQGRSDFDGMLARSYDADLDLRRELGDEEYTRYRQILGRSMGMEVSEVMPGGAGDLAGIKVGDEIVSYNGRRIFNVGELSAETKLAPAGSAALPLEVIRDGQRITLKVPGGNLGLRTPLPVRTIEERLKINRISADIEAERLKSATAR